MTTTTMARRRWILAIVVACVLAYGVTLWGDFVFDDDIIIVRNEQIRSLSQIPSIFSSPEWSAGHFTRPDPATAEPIRASSGYRPLTVVSYALNFAVSGLRPWSYHLVNIGLHILVSWMVFKLTLLWRCSTTAAGIAGLLFALHPIHVEAVANVIGRKDLLATAAVIATLLLHSWSRSRASVTVLIPAGIFGAGLLCKEVAVVAVPLVLVQDMLLDDESIASLRNPKRLVAYLVYGSVLALFLVARSSVVDASGAGWISELDNPVADANPAVRIITAIAVIGRGLSLFIAPVRLSPDYSANAVPVLSTCLDPWFLAGAGALVPAAVLALRWRRRRPVATMAFLWYAVALLPVSNIIFPIGTVFGERLLYLPSVGIFILFGWLMASAPNGRIRSAVIGAAVIGLFIPTVRYAKAWNSELELFTLATRNQPQSFKVHHKLGEALMDAGRPTEAIAAFQRALELAPRNDKSALGLAFAALEGRELDTAEKAFSRVLESQPGNLHALYGLASTKRLENRLHEAQVLWQRCLEINSAYVPALVDLGTFEYLSQNHTEAEDLWLRALQVDPEKNELHFNLGLLYQQLENHTLARVHFERFLAGDTTAQPEQRRIAESYLTSISTLSEHSSRDEPEQTD